MIAANSKPGSRAGAGCSFWYAARRGTILDNVTTDRARKLLDGCALFKALGERERHDLAALARTRSFATNEPIFHVGERAPA